jgi:hypothetical protein
MSPSQKSPSPFNLTPYKAMVTTTKRAALALAVGHFKHVSRTLIHNQALQHSRTLSRTTPTIKTHSKISDKKRERGREETIEWRYLQPTRNPA